MAISRKSGIRVTILQGLDCLSSSQNLRYLIPESYKESRAAISAFI